MPHRRRASILAICATLLLAGCGTATHLLTRATTTATTARAATATATSAQSTSPTASTAPTVKTTPADAAEVKVIEDWTTALAQGHVKAAARYFALPSVFANGFGAAGLIEAVKLRTLQEAEAVNASLTCGARLISASQHGKYIAAVFRLINRKGTGADCGSGTGQKAATDFVISHGLIDDWIRAPVPTGNAAPPVPSNAATPSQSD